MNKKSMPETAICLNSKSIVSTSYPIYFKYEKELQHAIEEGELPFVVEPEPTTILKIKDWMWQRYNEGKKQANL